MPGQIRSAVVETLRRTISHSGPVLPHRPFSLRQAPALASDTFLRALYPFHIGSSANYEGALEAAQHNPDHRQQDGEANNIP